MVGRRLYGQSSSGSDFPPSDSQILDIQRIGLRRELARQQQRAAADSPDTVRVLLETGLPQEALAVARHIVETRPERLVAVLNVIQPPGWFNESNAPEIVAAARKRLPSMPREDAATIARMLIVETYRPRGGPVEQLASELERFVEQYDGTTEAQRAKVDVIALRNRDTAKKLQAFEAFARQNPRTIEAARRPFHRVGDPFHAVGESRAETSSNVVHAGGGIVGPQENALRLARAGRPTS